MSTFYGKDKAQKEFLKIFDSLTGAHSRWEVWKDMIVIFATAISNGVDKRFWDEREKLYMETINRYSKEQQQRFADLFSMLVVTMDEQAQNKGFSDFLGELFMMLGLGNDSGGQFFTPYDVCRAMASMTLDKDGLQKEIEDRQYISVNDPACGAGATLIAAAETMWQWDINYQQTALFIGQDIDYTTALMCYVQLSLLGCAGYVRIGNTLTDPMTGSVLHGSNNDRNTWYMPMWFHQRWCVLRELDKVKRMISAVATPVPDAEQDKTIVNMVEKKVPVKPNKRLSRAKQETKPEPTPEPEPEFTYTVKENGQLSMF